MAESHLSTAQRSESRQTDRPTPTRPSPGAPADHRSGDSIVGGAVPPLLRIPGQSLFHPGRGLVIFWRELAEWTLLARPLEVLLPCPSDHTNLVMQTPHLTLNTATHKTNQALPESMLPTSPFLSQQPSPPAALWNSALSRRPPAKEASSWWPCTALPPDLCPAGYLHMFSVSFPTSFTWPSPSFPPEVSPDSSDDFQNDDAMTLSPKHAGIPWGALEKTPPLTR